MKILLPKQHGAWAMLIIPFWLGVAATSFTWQHIPFFIAWLFLYLATYPMLLLCKKKNVSFYLKWTIIYMIPAILFFLIPLVYKPKIIIFGLLMIPFFIVNAYHSSKNQDRAFINDISAIGAFSMAGLASGFMVSDGITSDLFLIFICSNLFFIGSTFYVKTMIREKRNRNFKWLSWCFHVFIFIVFLWAGELLVALAFLPSLIRAIIFYGKSLSSKKIGVYEIINAACIYLILAIRVM